MLIIGYGFNVEPLQTLVPGFPAMRPITAGLLMLLSVSCLLSLRGDRRLEWLSAAIGGGIVIYLVYEDTTHFNTPTFTIAQFRAILGTTLSIIFAGAAMVIINLRPRWSIAVGVIALMAAAPALYRILGLLLFWGAPQDETSPLNSMGLHTAILIVWFMLVCVLMHPRLPFAAAVLQASLRGRVLRAGLPFIVFVPVVAAVTSLALSVSLGWPVEALFALYSALSVTLAALLIWWLSQLVSDWQKEANEQASRLS
ncbi:MAG TPA: hypothetical protein VFA91_15095, partial [Candidatus Polarisedimenticolia bacterium]|nr:hypothetical protein [Candidatus Polarisedimenticolia bacterium]